MKHLKSYKIFESWPPNNLSYKHSGESPGGVWCMKTKNFDRIDFYIYEEKNPLETVPDFDRGDSWSIDVLPGTENYTEIKKFYPVDRNHGAVPDGYNPFRLIPKSDVLKVWFEKNKDRRWVYENPRKSSVKRFFKSFLSD